MSRDRLAALEDRIGHRFADRDLLQRALTHASYGDGRRKRRDNERLEFLGDRVLGLVVARHLFQADLQADEGALAPRLNALVRKEACARAARRAGVGEALRMSKSEESMGGRDKDTILGDACEALIAAIYLDAGFDAAADFIARFWAGEFEGVGEKPQDAKTRLQEWALARKFGAPVYEVMERKGPDHRPSFLVSVTVGRLKPADGEGRSKQAAERAAAEALIAREGVDA